jgi:hypothetical protein
MIFLLAAPLAVHLLASSPVIDSASILTVVGILVGISGMLIGGLTAWWAVKRKNSGKIETSEASTLWQAQESMRKDLLGQIQAKDAQIDKTEEQRDRVISLFQEQLVPSIAQISKTQEIQLATIAEVLTVLRATGPLPPENGRVSA